GTDVVNQTAAVTATANTFAYALRINDAIALNLGGNTLALGGGAASDPAMLIVNPTSTLTNGTVDFGGHPAIVHAANTAGTVSAALTNATSFTKTGLGALVVSTPMSYSGNTYVAAGSIQNGISEIIPDTSDVVLAGNSSLSSLGALNLNAFTETINSLNGNAGA